MRHGESEANIIREISNRGVKHGLTPRGKDQAAALAENLRGVGATRIYSSPLLRATQTAEILSAALGIPYVITDALREYDCGIVEGRGDEAAWDLWRTNWTEWFERGNKAYRIEGGESYRDIEARFAPFIHGLIAEKGRTNESIILVGHGGTYGCMLPDLLGNRKLEAGKSPPFPNTGYVLIEAGPDGMKLIEWCGTEY